MWIAMCSINILTAIQILQGVSSTLLAFWDEFPLAPAPPIALQNQPLKRSLSACDWKCGAGGWTWFSSSQETPLPVKQNTSIIKKCWFYVNVKTGALEWFSEERVLRQAREAWQAMNADQREEYGETHFQETVRAVHDYIKDDKVILFYPHLMNF